MPRTVVVPLGPTVTVALRRTELRTSTAGLTTVLSVHRRGLAPWTRQTQYLTTQAFRASCCARQRPDHILPLRFCLDLRLARGLRHGQLVRYAVFRCSACLLTASLLNWYLAFWTWRPGHRLLPWGRHTRRSDLDLAEVELVRHGRAAARRRMHKAAESP